MADAPHDCPAREFGCGCETCPSEARARLIIRHQKHVAQYGATVSNLCAAFGGFVALTAFAFVLLGLEAQERREAIINQEVIASWK